MGWTCVLSSLRLRARYARQDSALTSENSDVGVFCNVKQRGYEVFFVLRLRCRQA